MYLSPLFLKRIYKTGLLITIALLLADLLAFFYYKETIFGDIFLATREQTPLTWISSVAMLFIALSCFSAYLESKKTIWYFLSIVFLFFSIDDAVYLHERLSGFFQDNTTILNFFPTYTWVVLYFPLLAFSLGALIYLLWKNATIKNKKYISAAFLILGFAIFLDLLDGFLQKNPTIVFCLDQSCNLATLHITRLTEEILEVFALGILGYTNIQENCIYEEKR